MKRIMFFLTLLVFVGIACKKGTPSELHGYTATPAIQTITSTPKPESAHVPNATITDVPTPQIVCVTADKALNFRDGPGTDNQIYTVLVRGTRLVKNSEVVDASGSLWYQVTFIEEGAGGWVAAKYVGDCK